MFRRLCLGVSILAVCIVALFIPRTLSFLERRSSLAVQQAIVRPPVHTVASVHRSSESLASSARHAINLAVPFVVQAPGGTWDALHQEACEEASILMVLGFTGSRDIPFAPVAQDAMLQSIVRRAEEMGFSVDLTAEQAMFLLRDLDPSLRVSLLYDPSIKDVQDALHAGSVLIVPALGRLLGNPYFRSPGPLYHMLVIRGYTEDGYVITNDPGTKHGEQFVYSWETLLHANHDWHGGNVPAGERVMIVVGRG